MEDMTLSLIKEGVYGNGIYIVSGLTALIP